MAIKKGVVRGIGSMYTCYDGRGVHVTCPKCSQYVIMGACACVHRSTIYKPSPPKKKKGFWAKLFNA